MKLTCKQQKLVTENNLYSVRENLKNICSYYIVDSANTYESKTAVKILKVLV